MDSRPCRAQRYGVQLRDRGGKGCRRRLCELRHIAGTDSAETDGAGNIVAARADEIKRVRIGGADQRDGCEQRCTDVRCRSEIHPADPSRAAALPSAVRSTAEADRVLQSYDTGWELNSLNYRQKTKSRALTLPAPPEPPARRCRASERRVRRYNLRNKDC